MFPGTLTSLSTKYSKTYREEGKRKVLLPHHYLGLTEEMLPHMR